MMDDKIFYLIKDVGVPTFFCCIMSVVLYKVIDKGLRVIEKNTCAIDTLQKLILNKL